MHKFFREYVNPDPNKRSNSGEFVNVVNAHASTLLAYCLSKASKRLVYRCNVEEHGRDNNGQYIYTRISVQSGSDSIIKPNTIVRCGRMIFMQDARVAEVYTHTKKSGRPSVRITLFDDEIPGRFPNMFMQIFGYVDPKPIDATDAVLAVKELLRGVATLRVKHA